MYKLTELMMTAEMCGLLDSEGNELSYNTYRRQYITFEQNGSVIANDKDIVFPSHVGETVDIFYVGLFSKEGELIVPIEMHRTLFLHDGDVLTLPKGDVFFDEWGRKR